MPITLITGPANAGKARAVLDVLREHRARGEHPLLVVPTRADTERYGSELASAGLAPGVRVERFDGLIAEVVGRAGGAQAPLGALARERILAAVAGRTTRGVTRALVAFVAELHVRRVDAARLRAALADWAHADPAQRARADQLATLYEEYERVLRTLGRTDPEQRATRALDELRRTPTRWGTIPVALYGFDDFTPLQLDAIETLGTVVGARVTVALAFERGREAFAGRAGTFQTLLPLAAEHRELAPRAEYYAPRARGALHHLERYLFEPQRPADVPLRVAAAGAVRLLEGGGERAELELVAEEIAGLLRRGTPPAEIAVAHRAPATIAELLGEVFTAHRIPYALERRVRFADTALGRALLGALAAACEPDAELEHLLAWLRAPGVLEDPDLADELEARARRAGIASAAGARALWEQARWPPEPLEPLERLRAAPAGRGAQAGAQALIECATHELERLAVGSTEIAQQREARALRAARAALDELRELASADPRSPLAALAPDAGVLIATLRGLEFVLEVSAREADRGAPDGPGPPAPGDARADGAVAGVNRPAVDRAAAGVDGPATGVNGSGADGAVAVLDPLALRARRVRALFLCGLQEGIFPAPARAEPLLSEDERRRLVETSGLLALAGDTRSADTLAAERYLLYAAVSRPEELLVLSWHTADDDGAECSRSLFVDDVRDVFACDLHGARSRRALGEVGEERMGSVVAQSSAAPARPPGGVDMDRPAGAALPADPRRPTGAIAPLRAERVLADLREPRMWSASGLQAWAGCPVQWFVERLLGARDLEPEPEPLARGGLAHAVLRDVLEGLRRETGSARLRPGALARARELLHAALTEREHEYPLSVAPERVPGVRRRLAADLERYLEHAAACESPLEPTHLELSFGFPEEHGLPALELAPGVRVRGRIDRVDLDPTGSEAVVYDYKGSHAPEAGRWARERSFQVALYMRAVESLPGVRAAGGFYQPLAGRDLRARGALDDEAAFELDCVRGDTRERDQLQALVEEAVSVARTAAEQARAGELQARPATCGFGGGGCQYPTICRCEQ
jgi:ATP-dependent helicase/DNAse subunit B